MRRIWNDYSHFLSNKILHSCNQKCLVRAVHCKKFFQRSLNCARSIARIFCGEEFKRRARTPDRPYSLFEGIAGTLCFLCDLMEPDKAQFPLVPIPFV